VVIAISDLMATDATKNIEKKARGGEWLIEQINDQKFLEKIAVEYIGADHNIKVAALQKVNSQEVKSQIAIKYEDKGIWSRASLAEFRERGYTNLGLIAVEGLSDQMYLEIVAKEARDKFVRQAAVEKIETQEILKAIAEGNDEDDVRAAAVARIKDQQFLEKIASSKMSPHMRETALELISNIDILEDAARGLFEGDTGPKHVAIRRMGELLRNNAVGKLQKA
jgi:hypothetical protein